MSQLIGLGGPQGPAGSSPQPTSWDKAEAQREPDVPSLTQQTVESQCGNAGLLTPRSVLPSIQVAQAMFPRALFPLSGVELLSAPHIHTLFPCSLAESPSWEVLDSKQNVSGNPETLGLGWGAGGAAGEKRALGQEKRSLLVPAREQVTGSSLLPATPVPPARASGRGPLTRRGPGVLKMGLVT